jgi:hypothetical protein
LYSENVVWLVQVTFRHFWCIYRTYNEKFLWYLAVVVLPLSQNLSKKAYILGRRKYYICRPLFLYK